MMVLLEKSKLQQVLETWARITEVYTPQSDAGQVMLLPYEKEGFTMEYINFAFPVKEYIFSPKEVLFRWENDHGKVEVSAPAQTVKRRIYFGVRACDAYGLEYMDHFYLDGYRDTLYGAKREKAIIVAVNCAVAGANCFCSSMGTGPFLQGGYDLLLTLWEDFYLLEAGTEAGEALIALCGDLVREDPTMSGTEKASVLKAAALSFGTKIHTDRISDVLEKNFNDLLWDSISVDCISCTGCTTLCPTCTCFNAVEETDGKCSGCRVRYWDSCQSDSFTRNAGKHNPRSRRDRVRYRIYDKFKYIEDKFHYKGCSGCGRCIDVCPASIHVVNIINELAGREGK